jgi:toxin ParE1/3/4
VAELFLTRRAIADLGEIKAYSVEVWGLRAAQAYLAKFEHGFDRLRVAPELLRFKQEISGCLLFYRVEKHWLVCDIIEDDLYVLAVRHGSMDLPQRIRKLEPQLELEAQILHDRICDSQ